MEIGMRAALVAIATPATASAMTILERTQACENASAASSPTRLQNPTPAKITPRPPSLGIIKT